MLPQIETLKERILLYNNEAEMGDYYGRLSSELQIYPSPRITWEFEAIGDEVKRKGQISQIKPLKGYGLSIDDPQPWMDQHDLLIPREVIAGNANQAIYGTLDCVAHNVNFYLPNAQFQSKNLLGQQTIKKVLKVGEKEIGSGDEGRLIDASLDGTWHVCLETRQKELEWLDRKNNNIGTLITTRGRLYSPMESNTKFTDYPTITLTEAKDYIQILCTLLSYANGGYIGPLYMEAVRFSTELRRQAPPSALVSAYLVTPLELIGGSWLVYDSNLELYINCFSTLKRMLSTKPWDEAFGLILAWYFQAIQPENSQTPGKQWPIVANAIGTALERLSYTILVLEEEDATKREEIELLFLPQSKRAHALWDLKTISPTGKRLQLLLEHIGLTLARGCWDINEVKEFLEVRNEATHPKSRLMDKRKIDTVALLPEQG